MASILDKYGIKEVADVTFYELNQAGKPTVPVLFLDTLKVSTIEQTAETTEARGGKGNAALISWDYNKEITVTLEDALFSAKSMAIMFGDGNTKVLPEYNVSTTTEADNKQLLMKTEEFIATATANDTSETATATANASAAGWNAEYIVNGYKYAKINPKYFDAAGATVTTFSKDARYFCTYDLATTEARVIEISANSFPGTYYVTGDTYARSQASGKDEFFQFIIPKAKVSAENTITLEAEGDPSVFNMNLTVLRPDDGVMMKLVKYDLAGGIEIPGGAQSTVWHNHELGARD